jgi:hypothetical protein
MKSRQYVRLESYRNQEKYRVLKLFRYIYKLLMSIVEDRRHVDVPSHSVKFDSIGLYTYSLGAYAPTYIDSLL